MGVREETGTVLRPPWRVRWRYSLLGLRLPEPYRHWAVEDIGSAGWLTRQSIRDSLGFAVFPLLGFLDYLNGEDGAPWLAVYFLLGWVRLATLLSHADRFRTQFVRYQLHGGRHPFWFAKPDRPPARAIVAWLGGGLVLGGILSGVVFLLTR